MKKTLLLAFVSMFAMQAHAATQDLINSVKKGDVPGVLSLLNNGEDVNGTDAGGTTALHYAVAYDNPEITQILLSYGADLTAANAKGWTPLKIAEKKELKHVTPILVQYLQLQKQEQKGEVKAVVTETVAAVEEIPVKVNEKVAEAVENSSSAVVETNSDVQSPALAQAAEVMEADVEESQKYQKMLDLATQAVIDARSEKNQAETQAKILADELKQVKAEKAELEAKLAEKDAVKTEVKSEAKFEPEPKPEPEQKEETKAEVKETVAVKPAPKQVKPVLQKKPVYKTPQPIVKKVVIKPSTLVEGIYAGDEEIVYCLDYLGNGENDNLKRAAGYFAASASIGEARYKQIVDKANTYFMNAGDADMTARDTECSKIITPSNHDKQNQIVRSINKSVGY